MSVITSAATLAGFAFHTPKAATTIDRSNIAKDQSKRPLGENPYQYPANKRIIPNTMSMAPPSTVMSLVQDGPSFGIYPYLSCNC